MKKILYTMMGVGMLFAATSCEDFLDTSSPSEADVDFVFSEASTARAALYNAYEKWRGNAGVHSNGVFYDLVVCGSDAERHPEAYASQIARHVPEIYMVIQMLLLQRRDLLTILFLNMVMQKELGNHCSAYYLLQQIH